jgi:hypothetical protein
VYNSKYDLSGDFCKPVFDLSFGNDFGLDSPYFGYYLGSGPHYDDNYDAFVVWAAASLATDGEDHLEKIPFLERVALLLRPLPWDAARELMVDEVLWSRSSSRLTRSFCPGAQTSTMQTNRAAPH